MDGEGVLSQIRDLQSVIDGFQLDCAASGYGSEDMENDVYEAEMPASPIMEQTSNDIMERQPSDVVRQSSNDIAEKLCNDTFEEIDGQGDGSVQRDDSQSENCEPQSESEDIIAEALNENLKEEEPHKDKDAEESSSQAIPERIQLDTATNVIPSDPFELGFRISTDFSTLLDEFSSKEYPVSPVKIQPAPFKSVCEESQRLSASEMQETQEKLRERINKQKADILKGAMWRREVSRDRLSKVTTGQAMPEVDTTLQEKNTRSSARPTSAKRTTNKTSKGSPTTIQNHAQSQIPADTVPSEEEKGGLKRRGDNDHHSRCYEQIARIHNIEDRISLYDDYFLECINAKTGLLKWTEEMQRKGKPAPMTEGYEPSSRTIDLSKSMFRSRSNLMVVTSSTSMNALRRSIMKIPKPEQSSRKSGGNSSASPNSENWLENISTPRIKERALSFLSFRNLTPARGVSTPNLRLISGPSQGLFSNKSRQISPMEAPTPMLRSNRVMNFKKDEKDMQFRQSMLPPTMELRNGEFY